MAHGVGVAAAIRGSLAERHGSRRAVRSGVDEGDWRCHPRMPVLRLVIRPPFLLGQLHPRSQALRRSRPHPQAPHDCRRSCPSTTYLRSPCPPKTLTSPNRSNYARVTHMVYATCHPARVCRTWQQQLLLRSLTRNRAASSRTSLGSRARRPFARRGLAVVVEPVLRATRPGRRGVVDAQRQLTRRRAPGAPFRDVLQRHARSVHVLSGRQLRIRSTLLARPCQRPEVVVALLAGEPVEPGSALPPVDGVREVVQGGR